MVNVFDNVIGQRAVKKKLNFYLDSYRVTKKIPNLLITAPKGCGKSFISKRIGAGLCEFDEDSKVKTNDKGKELHKKIIDVNCATLKSLNEFLTSVIIPHINDPFTVVLDEAGSISKDITTALLTIIDPDPEKPSTTLNTPNGSFEFKRDKHSFILATSEAQSVFHSLQDRLVRIELEGYEQSDLAEIIQRKIPDVKFEDGVLEDMASVLRGNPRSATHMVNDINTHLKGGNYFSLKDWAILKDVLSILPLGLNSMELRVLKYLGENLSGVSLTRLSSKTGLTREALQRNYEPYLMGLDLMRVDTGGRLITNEGSKYLKNLAKKN
jgi:Holliday junction resolvasome RuvABC ATP-dependent DNA helicase subunit